MTFAPGQTVVVSDRVHDGHHRTPSYLKGRTGVIERSYGAFRDPELRAYGGDGEPRRTLYLVSFAQRELWPDYRGNPEDRVSADIYEHWLQ